jgi:hypothetical protein
MDQRFFRASIMIVRLQNRFGDATGPRLNHGVEGKCNRFSIARNSRLAGAAGCGKKIPHFCLTMRASGQGFGP